MNTKTILKALPLAAAFLLCSCQADEDSLISMVTDNKNLNNNNNNSNPLASTIPTGFDYDSHNNTMIGYVDLGLSVDWAICDLDAEYTPSQDLMDLMNNTGSGSSTQKNQNVQYLTLAEYNALIRGNSGGGNGNNLVSNYLGFITSNYSAKNFSWGDPNEHSTFYYPSEYYQNEPTGDWNAPNNYGGNPLYDHASKYISTQWATPTLAQWQELIQRCSVTKMTTDTGTKILIFTGPNGKSVAFAVNHCIKATAYGQMSPTTGDDFYYLTSTKSDEENECYIVSGNYWDREPGLTPKLGNTYNGYHIRPIRKKY